MAQIPVIVAYSCVLLRQIPSGRISVTGQYPIKKQAFFFSDRDVTGPSVELNTVAIRCMHHSSMCPLINHKEITTTKAEDLA